jgi:tRNA(Ile2) C34 agmatinyltransferase TiaS
MPDYSDSRTSGPSLWVIERPCCPKCQTRMSLARISPGQSGLEFRTFECTKCEQVLKEMIVTDPMKSDKAGWAASGLKAPE